MTLPQVGDAWRFAAAPLPSPRSNRTGAPAGSLESALGDDVLPEDEADIFGGGGGGRGIFDDEQMMPGGDFHDRIHFATDTRVMNGKDRFGGRGDGRFDQPFVDVQRIGSDVD